MSDETALEVGVELERFRVDGFGIEDGRIEEQVTPPCVTDREYVLVPRAVFRPGSLARR